MKTWINMGCQFGFVLPAARGKGPVRDPRGVPGTGIAPPKAGAYGNINRVVFIRRLAHIGTIQAFSLLKL